MAVIGTVLMLILCTYIPPSKYWGEGGGVVHKLFKYPTSFQGLSSSHPLERERGGKKRDPGNEVVKHRLCVDFVLRDLCYQ